MAYVIAEPCIGTKDNSCVEVCPVDCIHPTPDEPDYDKVEQLYIDPEECIDCDACVEACPVDACFAEDQLPGRVGRVRAAQLRVLRRQVGRRQAGPGDDSVVAQDTIGRLIPTGCGRRGRRRRTCMIGSAIGDIAMIPRAA